MKCRARVGYHADVDSGKIEECPVCGYGTGLTFAELVGQIEGTIDTYEALKKIKEG